MRFTRYPKAEPYEITPRKLAAARRAVQRQKDRFPLFPELITHQTAEERLDAIAYGRAEWWQSMRDHQAKQWRRARKSLRDLPRGPRAAITRYWQICGYPGDPVYLLVQMRKMISYRTRFAITTLAALWSTPALLPAAELHPLVVTGIPPDKVATVHPTPVYPRVALALGIGGIVRVEVKVQNGLITEANTLSGPPMLAYSAKAWIVGNWKFKPEISGVFTIPINYKRQA